MNSRLKNMSCVLLLAGAILQSSASAASTATEPEKIAQLIKSVREMKDAQFIRNGKAYDGNAAADHIQAKYDRVKDKIKTASEFIEKCASKSEASGEVYKIRLKDGTEKTASEWLTAKLEEIEKTAIIGGQ